ncbi:MAG: hypothetical protein ACI39U_05610, partial [Candidatus Cryptobacteroides sp.]
MKTAVRLIIAAAFLLSASIYADAQVVKPHKRNLTVREWNVDAGSTTKVMDHLTIYNENGRKIEEAEYDRYGVKWRKLYEYGENDKISRELVYGPNGKLDNIRKFEFDELGRKKTEYVYNPKGKLIR